MLGDFSVTPELLGGYSRWKPRQGAKFDMASTDYEFGVGKRAESDFDVSERTSLASAEAD